MGLDMMLEAEKFIGFNSEETAREIEDLFSFGLRPRKVVFEVMYWRKANAIHAWFVEYVQNGVDDCGRYWVPMNSLVALRDTIKRVLESTKTVPGKVCNGYTMKDGEMVPVMEDGEVVEDPGLAEELLPTQSGFFFGGTNYDQYYWQDLKVTLEVLEDLIHKHDTDANFNALSFYYSSSW